MEILNPYLTKSDVMRLFMDRCDQLGGQVGFANYYKLSRAYVNDVYHGRRGIGDKILNALGLRKIELYAKTDSPR